MELMANITVRPKIVPYVTENHIIVQVQLSDDDKQKYAEKFMSINRDKFECYIVDCLYFNDEAQNIIKETFGDKNVDVASARFTSFKHSWNNLELRLIFRISFYANDDKVVLREDKLKHYISEWMKEEGAYISLSEDEYWGDGKARCSFRVDVDSNDVAVVAALFEE